MAATYDPDQFDAVSRVRFIVADTDTAAPLLDDAVYDAALRLASNDEAAVARAVAHHLATKIAQEPDKVADIAWTQRIAQWRLIAQGSAGVTTISGSGGGSGAVKVGRITRGTEWPLI